MPSIKDILEFKQTILELVHDWGFNTTENIGEPKLYKDPYNVNNASLFLLVATDPNKQELIKDETIRKARLAYEVAVLTNCKVLVTTLNDYSNTVKLQEEIQQGAIELNSNTDAILKYYEDKPELAELQKPKLQKLRADILLPKDPKQVLSNHKQHINRVLSKVSMNNSHHYALFTNRSSQVLTMDEVNQGKNESDHFIRLIESELVIDEPSLLFSLQKFIIHKFATQLSKYIPARFFYNEQRIVEELMTYQQKFFEESNPLPVYPNTAFNPLDAKGEQAAKANKPTIQQEIHHHIVMRHERLLILANVSKSSYEHIFELIYKAIQNQMHQLEQLKIPLEHQDNLLLSTSKYNYESTLKNHIEQTINDRQLRV